jgi:hypothetical protein
MQPSSDCPIERNLPPKGHPWARWFQGLLYFIAFCVLAAGCLLWALGYRINRAAGTLEQTGVLELSTAQAGLNPEVYINGARQDTTLPVRMRWMFPGRYDIEIRKEGYQSWSRQVQISPNERVSFPSILLLFEKPREITPPVLRPDELSNRSANTRGIEVRFKSELWIRDEFVTRSSSDILQAEWYEEGRHIIYQAGESLVVRGIETGISQQVATFSDAKAPVPFALQENGRVLVYTDGDKLRAFELFAPRTLLDRLTPGR